MNHQRILVISPHPDDESIGCGGLLHQRGVEGAEIEVVFLTSGEKGGHGKSPAITGPLREQEAADAAKVLPISSMVFWREPDGALQVTPRLVSKLDSKIRESRPDLLLVPHEAEMHKDHQAAARLVQKTINALVAESPEFPIPEVWMFEVTPVQQLDQIIDISPSIDAKMAAIRAHKSQCDVMSFDEAFLGLARYRGEMHCWPGGEYAEAFMQWRPAAPLQAVAAAASNAGGAS